jgi:hypothetical protein
MSAHLALIYVTLSLLLFGAIETMVGNYGIPTFGQITPTPYPDSVPSDDNNDLGSAGPKTTLVPTGSNLTESQQPISIHKYSRTTGDGLSNEETLGEKIFSKVKEDLKASGITGLYP